MGININIIWMFIYKIRDIDKQVHSNILKVVGILGNILIYYKD